MKSSNIEPLAREMAENICRRSGMSEADIPLWVDLHWSCAAAMLEAGVMDESGASGFRDRKEGQAPRRAKVRPAALPIVRRDADCKLSPKEAPRL